MMRMLVLAMVVVGVGAAHAQPSAEFMREFAAGTDAFRLGDYGSARVHLEQARALAPNLPGPHRFLAAVDAAEGSWQACIDDARRAIVANPASNEIVATRKLHDDCRAALGRAQFSGDYDGGGAISVSANVAGAVVTIGGLKTGVTPMAPRPIGLGEVEVIARKTGWRSAATTATIIAGVVTDVELVMIEAPRDPIVDGSPVAPSGGWLRVAVPTGAAISIDGSTPVVDARGRYPLATGDHVVVVSQDGAIPARRTVRVARGQEHRITIALTSHQGQLRRRGLARAALGTAVGLGAVGIVTGLRALNASDEARDWAAIEAARPTTVPSADTAAVAPIHTRADIERRGDRAHTLGVISGISYGLSAAALGLGAYLMSRGGDPPGFTIAPMVGDGWGIALRGALP